MTEGPGWEPTFERIKRVPGNQSKNTHLGLQEVEEWQNFQRERTGADVAVAVGGVDTGNDFDGWGHVAQWGDNIRGALTGIFNGWFGAGGTGTAVEVTYTIEAIKEAVINGATVHGFAFDEVAWPVPAHVEAKGLVFGGGQSGGDVTGGLHGSLIASNMDLTGITALDIQIGTAGNRTFIREAATPPHTGAILMESPLHGSAGGVTNEMGLLTPTTSLPGSGGIGGLGGPGAAVATAGELTPLAVGGAAGPNGPAGGNGTSGGSVSTGSQTKCGGGGGGGGGGANGFLGAGGNGGAGGYPGGGGGGAGRGWSGGPNGVGGPGAPGQAYLYLK